MITQRGKLLVGIIAVFLFVCAYAVLAYNQYIQQKQIDSLVRPVVKTIVVTPTVEVTATPSASIKTRIGTPASATKGAVAK